MLTIYVEPTELYNETKNEFLNFNGGYLNLEHSLVSVQKWEAKWHIPFLDEVDRPYKQIKDYIRCMAVPPLPKDPTIYNFLSKKNVDDIVKYIREPMTATWFSTRNGLKGGQTSSREKITAEVIYYWMISLNIPAEYKHWHLNQLMTLIRVFTEKNKQPTKQSAQELAIERDRINEERKAKYKTTG